jgi:hypothetical protein
MNIREYIDYIKVVDPMVLKPGHDWRTTLDKMYPRVSLGRHGRLRWNEVHVWCQDQFGVEHYAWSGDVFWFDRKEDAVMFALRWS